MTESSLKKISLDTLKRYKEQRQRFTCLTAYDSTFSHLVSQAGIDVLLVGDSLGMVTQGHNSTVPVTIEDMVYHTQCVARGNPHSLIMTDLPFQSYASPQEALLNATRLMQAGAEIIKYEGGRWLVETTQYLSDRGIPVCAHLGLTPQTVTKLGGYHVQGREPKVAQQMILDAKQHEEAGADLLLLECVPSQLAATITEQSSIPVIGIGAGPETDAQVLVLQDMLGITSGRVPRFSKNFMPGHDNILDALKAYDQAVREGQFPEDKHGFQ